MRYFNLILLAIALTCNTAYAQQPVVITYACGFNGNLINTKKIASAKLTHLIYAFANLKNDRAYLVHPATDARNLENLINLKKSNPGLKVLLSVGGLGWSHNFSDMALTEAGRKTFAKSCTELLAQFDLDGIDIDWEFPGYPGEGGNIYRPADKQDYTMMFEALRQAMNDLQQQTGKHYLITAAVDGWANHFVPHTDLKKVARYTDYICLMTYDFNTPRLAGGHYLYSPAGWSTEGSADGAVNGFIAAGVPANKIVVGAGFFASAFVMNTADPLNRRYISRRLLHGGLYRAYRIAGRYGYKRYWDEEGEAPYLFNGTRKVRINYEDTASINAKCAYVMSKHLAGIMYWEYFSDPSGILLNTIHRSFSPGR